MFDDFIRSYLIMNQFYFCDCYLTHNIFIKEYSKHFNFYNAEQFFKDYAGVLLNNGCDDEPKRTFLLEKIVEEVERRKNLKKETKERQEMFKKLCKPLDSSIYVLQDNFLAPNFKRLFDATKDLEKQKILPFLDIISEEKQIYGFPVFTEEFCDRFLKELNFYIKSDLPKGRPNSMNRYGVLLDEIGFHNNFSQVFRTKYLDPLAAILFPEWRGQGLDSHKIFTVGYKIGEGIDLDYHYDNCEITLNVCLGKEFEGGELYFGDLRTKPISESTVTSLPHKVGYGIFHQGQQLHGALPITNGERHNLVFWLRASSVRNKLCPRCNCKPKNLIPSDGYGDGFTADTKAAVQSYSASNQIL